MYNNKIDNLSVKKTKLSIKNTVIELMLKNDYKSITVKKLTQQAQISTSTFYIYYNGIDDLVNSLKDELYEKVLILLQDIITLNNIDTRANEMQKINDIIKENYALYTALAKNDPYTDFFSSFFLTVRQHTACLFPEQYVSKYNLDTTLDFLISGSLGIIYNDLCSSGTLSENTAQSIIDCSASVVNELFNKNNS